MEDTQNTVITIAEDATATATEKNNKKPLNLEAAAKKKRGGMQLIRVALFMLRRRSGGKSNSLHVETANKGMWKRFVGSMRPLHLQDNRSPPPSITAGPAQTIEQFEDVLPPPMSPVHGPFSPSSSSAASEDSMSRYASAQNLQDLDPTQESDEIYDHGGDDMIDAKAKEFIAHFYEQLRLQRLDSFNRYNDMIARGMR